MENKTKMQDNAQATEQNAQSAMGNAFNMETLTGMLGNVQVPEKLKQYGDMAMKKVNNLSTTQKVIGGALLLLGAGYLTRRSKFNLAGLAGKMKR